jgi:mRNA interferase MazF
MLSMGQYTTGDVLLASVALDNRSSPKTRPVVVIRADADGTVHVCPVSSKAPTDSPCLPLSIDDFATGGLDLFSESYVMTSRVTTIRSSGVIGKRGRLTKDYLAEILARAPVSPQPGPVADRKKKPVR